MFFDRWQITLGATLAGLLGLIVLVMRSAH
jgi:hypothetical protein